nr:succinyl-CoA synthetase subunit beta [Marinobacter confluentis]
MPSVFSRRGRAVFWLALAGLICLFPLFFIGGPGWSGGPLIISAWNLGHPLFFALLTLAVRPWRFYSGWKLWLYGTAAVLLLGAGIELLQSLDTRDPDTGDMFRNLTGFWAVLALRPLASFQQSGRLQVRLLRLFAAAMLAIDLITVSRVALQQVQVSQWLPNLYDFRQANPGEFWRGNVTTNTDGSCGPLPDNALHIGLTTRRYSGASLDNLPSDWRGYQALEILLWNPQDYSIPLTLRINDMTHEQNSNVYQDRFNRTLDIAPGINRIEQSLAEVAVAPSGRKMEMNDVRRLMFFTSNLNQPARLCLGTLRLRKTPESE